MKYSAGQVFRDEAGEFLIIGVRDGHYATRSASGQEGIVTDKYLDQRVAKQRPVAQQQTLRLKKVA